MMRREAWKVLFFNTKPSQIISHISANKSYFDLNLYWVPFFAMSASWVPCLTVLWAIYRTVFELFCLKIQPGYWCKVSTCERTHSGPAKPLLGTVGADLGTTTAHPAGPPNMAIFFNEVKKWTTPREIGTVSQN